MQLLSEPGHTEYDLKFNLFGFGCRVHPGFWLLSVLLGYSAGKVDLVLIWVAVVFLSILVHELGHALAFRRYGINSRITLYHMGGLASPGHILYGTWKNIVTLLAGPGAGFLLAGALFAIDYAMASSTSTSTVAAYILFGSKYPPWLLVATDLAAVQIHRIYFLMLQLYFVNVMWGFINLVPLYPLDGGQICAHLFSRWSPQRGMEYALKLSILCAFGFGAWFATQDRFFTLLIFILLGFENIRRLQNLGRVHYY